MKSVRNEDYEIIDLEKEYPSIDGEVRWAVISDLDMETLMKKYGDELMTISPVILLSKEQGEAFKVFQRNEHKHEMRRIRTYEFEGYDDSKTEGAFIDSLSKYDLQNTDVSLDYQHIRDLIESLPEIQKRRCKLYFYHGYSEEDIARLEGVDQSNVSRSLSKAINKLKKMF